MAEEKHDGLRGVVDKVQDAVGGVVGLASASMASGSTAAFVEKARLGDLYEIEAAMLARRRAQDPDIQMMAEMILADHRTSSHQLMSALRTNEAPAATLPDALDSRHAGMLDHLRAAPDGDFDRMFVAQQKMAHQETLTLFEGYAESGDNPQLASYARGSIPALRDHNGWADVVAARLG
jgi:putative membrane protein